jgi:cullin 1
MSNEGFLDYYAKEWDRYTTGARFLNRVFRYVNNFWVKRKDDNVAANLHYIYTVSIYSF